MFSLKAIVADVEKGRKTVVGWLVKEYSAFYKAEPTIETVVDDTVQYAEIGLPIVLGVTGGEALAPEVDDVLNDITSGLKVVSATIYDFGPSPTAASVLAGVQTNLQNLETVAGIKDPAKLAKLQLIVNAVGALGSLIAKAVAAAEAPTPAPAADPTPEPAAA